MKREQQKQQSSLFEQSELKLECVTSILAKEMTYTSIRDQKLLEKQQEQKLKEISANSHQPNFKKKQNNNQNNQENQQEELTLNNKMVPGSASIISSANALQSKISSLKNVQVNPDIISRSNIQEISYIINYLGDFSYLKKIFCSLGTQKKMNLIQSNQSICTIRQRQLNYCLFFIKNCIKSIEDPSVYQLKDYPSQLSKAKIILISGDVKKFQNFKKEFLTYLWQNSRLQICQEQALQLFFHSNKLELEVLKSELQSILKQKIIDNNTIFNMMSRIKQNEIDLKKSLKKNGRIKSNPVIEKRLEEIIYQMMGINRIYQKQYQTQQKKLSKKKEDILKKYTIKEIFQHLEIANQLNQLKPQNWSTNRQSIPYYSAICALQNLRFDLSPSTILQIGSIFIYKIRECWNLYHENKVKLSDMDDELPIVIYIILQSKQLNLLITVKLINDYLKNQDNFDQQKKIFVTIQSAIQYICENWKNKIIN